MSNKIIKFAITWRSKRGEEGCFYQNSLPSVILSALDVQKLLRTCAIYAFPDQVDRKNYIIMLCVDDKIYDIINF